MKNFTVNFNVYFSYIAPIKIVKGKYPTKAIIHTEAEDCEFGEFQIYNNYSHVYVNNKI